MSVSACCLQIKLQNVQATLVQKKIELAESKSTQQQTMCVPMGWLPLPPTTPVLSLRLIVSAL